MKSIALFMVFISTTVIGLSETRTFKWTTAKETDRKIFHIPAGKVGKVISWSQKAGGATVKFSVEVEGEFILFQPSDELFERIVSGPNRLGVETDRAGKYMVTLEITDQDSPPSGLTLTDE